MIKPPSSFVLFADVLGFKRLVLDNKVPYPENLEFRQRPVAGTRISGLVGVGNPLSRGFTGFHGAVHDVLNTWAFSGSLLVFSDSLFLATQQFRQCFGFAERLMRSCVMAEVPLRMGVGYGTFVSYGFAFEESPEIRFLSSQFFGSGVVHATEAEKALKGMRIAVDRSAVEQMTSEGVREDKLLSVPANQVSPGIAHEWNYLPEWPEIPELYGAADPDLEVLPGLRRCVDHMQQRAPQAADIQVQYQDTLQALGRMSNAVDEFLKARTDTHRRESD